MCFSATASFGLSAMLLPTGVYCVYSAVARSRALLSWAVIPIVFSIQQLCEGLIWVALGREDAHQARGISIVYLAFALAFWPCWIPFCAFLREQPGNRKWLFACISAMGLSGGLVLYVPIVLHPDLVTPVIVEHSIYYEMDRAPAFQWMPFGGWQVLYVLAVASPLLAPFRAFLPFGIAIVVSSIVSHLVFWYASASVWCFFAAGLSLLLCVEFWRQPASIPVPWPAVASPS